MDTRRRCSSKKSAIAEAAAAAAAAAVAITVRIAVAVAVAVAVVVAIVAVVVAIVAVDAITGIIIDVIVIVAATLPPTRHSRKTITTQTVPRRPPKPHARIIPTPSRIKQQNIPTPYYPTILQSPAIPKPSPSPPALNPKVNDDVAGWYAQMRRETILDVFYSGPRPEMEKGALL